ncbi:lysozyme inhibitor LprI family protein [Ruegeria sp. Alg231-54]|uniref:lysozyme inhibitor LprI family protein n=1 Tax=Ruegeria sp. Alg231-54 TaxID=1922221 RepID=UPI000D55FDB6|nr:lysozyme inhibitor LprI family protein [Ruegeria sp. Alg231-54]
MNFFIAYSRITRSIFRYLAFSTLSLICLPLSALSMSFKVEPSPINDKVTLVVGRGAIETGDAARFEDAISAHPPNFRALLVTSPGGNVAAAVELAKRITANSFGVIAHQECASSCAMILFPAGDYSILTKGSMLGIHSCSASGVRHNLCNEAIAEFAVSNGFPFGTLEMFSDLYGPGEMKWMTEISARCFGFYRRVDDPKPIHGERKACVDGIINTMGPDVRLLPFGPSFNCAKATTKVEQLFCIDKELMQSDSILGRVYDRAIARKNNLEKKDLRSNQRQWIASRNADCEQLFTSSMDFVSTRDAALCLFQQNEERIYTLIDTLY